MPQIDNVTWVFLSSFLGARRNLMEYLGSRIQKRFKENGFSFEYGMGIWTIDSKNDEHGHVIGDWDSLVPTYYHPVNACKFCLEEECNGECYHDAYDDYYNPMWDCIKDIIEMVEHIVQEDDIVINFKHLSDYIEEPKKKGEASE